MVHLPAIVQKWKSLEGEQAKNANKFISKQASDSDITTTMPNVTALPFPHHGGFHQSCYAGFTDSQRLDRVTKSIKMISEESACTGLKKFEKTHESVIVCDET